MNYQNYKYQPWNGGKRDQVIKNKYDLKVEGHPKKKEIDSRETHKSSGLSEYGRIPPEFAVVLVTALLFVNACGEVQATQPVNVNKPPESVPTLDSGVIYQATETAISPVATKTPEANYFAGGGSYDDEQKKLIEALRDGDENVSKNMKDWDSGIKGFYKYWVGSKTVAARDEIPVVWVFDEKDPHNGDKAIAYVDLPFGRGNCFSLPLVNGKPQFVEPSLYVDGQNEFGQGPLELTKSGYLNDGRQYFLGNDSGNWARYDKPYGQQGDVIQRPDLNGNGWIEVETVGSIVRNLGLQEVVKVGESFSYRNIYRIDGDYLRNDYNNTIAAVKENGVWKALGESQEDKNLKYGELAGSLDKEVFQSETIYSMIHGNDNRFKGIYINVIFTGIFRTQDLLFSRYNNAIKDYQGLVTFLNRDGSVMTQWVSICSPDLSGKIMFRFENDLGNWGEPKTCEEVVTLYQPKDKLEIAFIYSGPNELAYNICYDNGVCTEEFNKMELLRSQYGNELKEFAASLLNSDLLISANPNMVLPTDIINLRKRPKNIVIEQ